MYVSAMSVKVREGKNAGTSCEKTSHGRFSANKWGESTERACLTADFSKKRRRIDRESVSHGRFQQISGENRPRERVSRQISAKKGGESTERARLTAGTGQILAYYGQKKPTGSSRLWERYRETPNKMTLVTGEGESL